MQSNISQADLINPNLPLPKNFSRGCPRSARMDLDHLLLAIEAIDVQAAEAMLYFVQQLNLQSIIPNRVSLWRIRNTNPLRRHYQRGTLTWEETKALVLIACAIARQLNTVLRQLLTTSQQISEQKIDILGLQQNKLYLDAYLERFRSLYLSRMRSPSILSNDEIKDLALQLLTQLMFYSGTAGELRLWYALFEEAIV